MLLFSFAAPSFLPSFTVVVGRPFVRSIAAGIGGRLGGRPGGGLASSVRRSGAREQIDFLSSIRQTVDVKRGEGGGELGGREAHM